jgi:hypothetical protein
MSSRTSILSALINKMKDISVANGFKTELYTNAYDKLEFWDSVENFPAIYAVAGSERREYLPGGFKWGYLSICTKVYCKGENSVAELEALLEDIEKVIDSNQRLVYDSVNNYEIVESHIDNITTDEGLLAPYAIGEVNIMVQYQVMT